MMHTTLHRLALAATLVAGLPVALHAQAEEVNQDNTPFGSTAAEFLLLGAGARGTALGGAFSALVEDVSALYYNPAGVALLQGPAAMFSTYEYVAETRYSWGGIAFPFSGGARAIGFQLGTFGFDDQPVYTAAQPEGTGSVYSVNETFAGITYAENFSDRFSAGITAKFVFDQLGDAEGSAFAVDFGTNFHAMLANHPVRFSFTLANLGTNMSYSGDALNADLPREALPGEDEVPSVPVDSRLRTKAFPLPTIFRVGLAYDLVAGTNNRLTILGDFNQPTNNRAGAVGGFEWALDQIGETGFGASVRGSYSYTGDRNLEPATLVTALNDEENLGGIAFGGGLWYGSGSFKVGFDYAYKYLGVLGPTNFFTLSVGW
ncbi:MAG: PorV/PorQ family protein [Gemmatimonadales bacterium]|nr:PorV/PorQ family protein [Gemmatimonadales bacterium]